MVSDTSPCPCHCYALHEEKVPMALTKHVSRALQPSDWLSVSQTEFDPQCFSGLNSYFPHILEGF
jgi:hypothetical protein